MPARIRVAVLFGGRSTEHAISCVSAGSVLRALDRDRYDVVPIGITAEGRWVLAPDDPELLTARGRELLVGSRAWDAGRDDHSLHASRPQGRRAHGTPSRRGFRSSGSREVCLGAADEGARTPLTRASDPGGRAR